MDMQERDIDIDGYIYVGIYIDVDIYIVWEDVYGCIYGYMYMDIFPTRLSTRGLLIFAKH